MNPNKNTDFYTFKSYHKNTFEDDHSDLTTKYPNLINLSYHQNTYK